jgi:hypothetical protein
MLLDVAVLFAALQSRQQGAGSSGAVVTHAAAAICLSRHPQFADFAMQIGAPEGSSERASG